jgi:Flp pilus assembly protein TadD
MEAGRNAFGRAEALRLMEQGIALRRQGRLDEAVRAYEAAIARDPALAEAHYNLGVALGAQGRIADAARSWRRAAELKPGFVPALNNLGSALLELGDVQGAAAQHRLALKADPRSAGAMINLGNALRLMGDAAGAVAQYRAALDLARDTAMTEANMALALRDLGRLDEAEGAYRRAIALKPDYAVAHKDLGMLLLLRGRYDEGWREYQWRWKTPLHRPREYGKPLWRGEDIAGRAILLHMDQGHGDTIHFLRYAPLVAERGARVVLEVQPSLLRLASGLAGVQALVAAGETPPPVDLVCPLLDLPGIFGTRPGAIPAGIPYLSAEPEAEAAWRRRLAAKPGMKVGLVWAGNAAFSDDFRRSPGAKPLAALLTVPGVHFVSLQAGPAAASIGGVPGGGKVERAGEEFRDFADTAACIAALDLVISSCTSVPHLAGAMGKTLWLALGKVPDWRWGLTGGTCEWYPTARLFRQETPGDWEGVFRRMADALAAAARAKA